MKSGRPLSQHLPSPASLARIIRLSGPQPVSMAEQWFELVGVDHFWMIRRLEVLKALCGRELRPPLVCAEVGCGNGILQRQLETEFGLAVDGFDLGLAALEMNQSSQGELYYYNVYDRRPEFKERYEAIFLFDVLEHIEEEESFLSACLFHLKAGGRLIINVPSRQELFSAYDRSVGHVRRYALDDLQRLAEAAQLTVLASTYWGLPLYPLLLARKMVIALYSSSRIVEKGIKPPNRWVNRLLLSASRLEFIPQRLMGTSVMAVLEKKST